MCKAFKFTTEDEDDSENEIEEVHCSDTDSTLLLETVESVQGSLPTVKHLRCFSHTLQLCITDGLKDCRLLYAPLGKCSKIASLLHSSTTFLVSESTFIMN